MKAILLGGDGDRSPMVPILRIFTGMAMLTHGLPKIYHNGQFFPELASITKMVTQLGLPLPAFLAIMAILTESLGALLLTMGLATRLAAFFLTATMLVAAFLVHAGDPFAKRELALFYLVIALTFLFKGGGRWSLDAFLK